MSGNNVIVGRIAAAIKRERLEGVPTVVVVEIVRQVLPAIAEVLPECLALVALGDVGDADLAWCEVCQAALYLDEDLHHAGCDRVASCEHAIAETIAEAPGGGTVRLCRGCSSKAVAPPAPLPPPAMKSEPGPSIDSAVRTAIDGLVEAVMAADEADVDAVAEAGVQRVLDAAELADQAETYRSDTDRILAGEMDF